MKVVAVLVAVACFSVSVQASNVICGAKTTSKSVTVEDGDTFSFKTQKGKKYRGNTKCTVDYKMGDTCAKMSFVCTKFNTNNKDKKKCSKGDKVTVTANGKSKAYCKTKKAKAVSTGDMSIVFTSDKKKHGTGAVCKVKCTEAVSSGGTGFPTNAPTSSPCDNSGSCSDVLSVSGKHFANGNYEKAPTLHQNRVWYSEASGKWCIFFGQHWQVDNCDFVRDNENNHQGFGWSKSNSECPGDIGPNWRYYSWVGSPNSGPVDTSIIIKPIGFPTNAPTSSPCENSGYVVQTYYGTPETLSLFKKNIFAIWWDPAHDHSADAEPLADILISIRDDCLNNLGMKDPPNPGKGFFYNVYIHHGEDDLFPSGWGMGQGTDPFGQPYLTMHYGGLFSKTLYHEGFHIFQYDANSPGFAYAGDSQWFIETSAQWYTVKKFREDKKLFREAGAILANPQLALWHSFGNHAPNDPASDAGRPGWMYGVRQYGMHTYLVFLTEVMGMERKFITDGFYASTNMSPQEYLFSKVGAEKMRGLFADWAAHNTGGMDYLTKEQLERAYLEITLAGDWDYYRPYVWSSVDEGTGGDWFTPPPDLTARGWAYNVLNINTTQSASYSFEFEGDATGSQGATSFFVCRIVIMSKNGPIYSDMTMSSSLSGTATVSVAEEDSSVFLVVASVPEFFTSYQHYSYKVKILKQ